MLLQTKSDLRFAEITIPKLTDAIDSLASELKRSNDLKEKEAASHMDIEQIKKDVYEEYKRVCLIELGIPDLVESRISDAEGELYDAYEDFLEGDWHEEERMLEVLQEDLMLQCRYLAAKHYMAVMENGM